MKHAPLSPSQAYRWTQCPGSVALTRGIVQPESEYAKLGTDAHLVAAARLSYEIHDKRLPKKLPALPDEHLDAVETYLNYSEQVVKRQGKNSIALVETKLRAPEMAKDLWGTADLVVYSKTKLEIIDLKTGVVPVEVKDNLQLLIYAGLARGMLDLKPRDIVLHLVQPRAYHPDGPVRTWQVSSSDLSKIWQRILVMGELALSKIGERMFASGPHCQFCPAAGGCRTRAQQSLIEDFVEEDRQIEAHLLSDREMGEMLNRIELVEEIAGPIKEEAERRALAGRKILGHKLIRRGGKRFWADEEEVMVKLSKAGIDEEIWLEKSLVSFTKLEKLKDVAPLIRGYIKSPVGKLALVPESDPHPEENPHTSARRDFEDSPLPETKKPAGKKKR